MKNSIVYLNNICIFGEQLKQIGIMKDLTIEQLENQISLFNNTRFLLEREYNVSTSTLSEIIKIMKELTDERDSRLQ